MTSWAKVVLLFYCGLRREDTYCAQGSVASGRRVQAYMDSAPYFSTKLLQQALDLECRGTPTAVLVDANGNVASDLAIGAPAIVSLLDSRRSIPV